MVLADALAPAKHPMPVGCMFLKDYVLTVGFKDREGTLGQFSVDPEDPNKCAWQHTQPCGAPVCSVLVVEPFLFVGLDNGVIRVINTTNGNIQDLPEGHEGKQVTALCTYNSVLISAGARGAIASWQFDAATGQFSPLKLIKDPALIPGGVLRMQVYEHYLFAGLGNGNLQVYDFSADAVGRQEVKAHDEAISGLGVTQLGPITCCTDGYVRAWPPSQDPSQPVVAAVPGQQEPSGRPNNMSPCWDLVATRDAAGAEVALVIYEATTPKLWGIPVPGQTTDVRDGRLGRRGAIKGLHDARCACADRDAGMFAIGSKSGNVRIYMWLGGGQAPAEAYAGPAGMAAGAGY
ncbi:unnamed protein product [Pedinophyceae sp. YPF-701]|nr:unnamed protein product [Pedinophyceae sp. YPF-701]